MLVVSPELSMPTSLSSVSPVSSVSVVPDFVLHERTYGENSVQYDPDAGVLTVLRDRLTEPGDVQIVLPAQVDDHALSVELDAATSQVVTDERSIVLPQLAMYEELSGTLVFTPAPTEAKPPPVKVKITIRVRPTGGG